MTTALVATQNNTMAVAEQYLESFGNKLTKEHKTQFLQIAAAFNLNPFTREIYGIPFDDKFNIIVGYEVYLKRAENSGKLDGWKAWTEGTMTKKTIKKTMKKKDGGTWDKEVETWEGDMKGCIEIFRNDRKMPFYHEVAFSEYNQENSMWNSKPQTMIKKVAIAQGFRMAFPVELGGIPYTSDEMPSITPEPAPPLAIVDTIDRSAATSIANELRLAKINPAELFNAFGVTRLGELKTAQLPDVDSWIQNNAPLPDNIVDAEMEPTDAQTVNNNAMNILQEVFTLIAKLSELRGETGDDIIDALTKGKCSAQVDLQDKPDNYLNDLKLMIENEIASEA